MRFLHSLAFLAKFILVTAYYYCVLAYENWSTKLRGRKYTTDMAHDLACRWAKGFFRANPCWKISISGQKNLPSRGQAYVMVANHESATDILCIYNLNTSFRWLSKHTIFRIPMVGWAMSLAGYVKIVRGDRESHEKALSKCADWLKSGVPVLFFPEGTRSNSGSPKAFKKGAFKLAKECGVPVLPIAIHGGGRLLKKGSLNPEKARVHVKVLPLVDSPESESSSQFCARVREQIVSEHASLATNVAVGSETGHQVQTLS